ncbi:MAG TPA: hypothetical protein VK498_06100 [Ferruginibacter sp.]|nr:hypothetical protein [Ferruginibacter sp.]
MIKKILPGLLFCISMLLISGQATAQKKYSGNKHTTSHGGRYSSGSGSSHKGGHYKLSATRNHYGRHKH